MHEKIKLNRFTNRLDSSLKMNENQETKNVILGQQAQKKKSSSRPRIFQFYFGKIEHREREREREKEREYNNNNNNSQIKEIVFK